MYTSCVLAVALLTAEPNEPLPLIDPAEWPALRAALHGQAVEWEVLDPREDRLHYLEDLAADLKVLRRRYHDLRDAPPLRDAKRFPDRRHVAELLSFNRSYRRGLEQRQAMDRSRAYALKEAMKEADDLHRVWDLVREARCEIYYVAVRRMALKKLRDALGETAYHASDLPPHVPEWRFIDVR